MSAFPTLSQPPNYPLVEEIEDTTIVSNFESGYIQTRPRFTRRRKSFTVRYENLSTSDKTSLETFRDVTVLGSSETFTWTHPLTSTVYTMRFEKDKTPKFTNSLIDYWDTEFTIREV